MDELLYAGKKASEMTKDELIEACLYFKNAHAANIHRMADIERKVSKLAEAVSQEELSNLDLWIKWHKGDFQKGDGREQWPNWRGSYWKAEAKRIRQEKGAKND